MRILGFNQLIVKGKTHNLSKLRSQIIEQECHRVGDVSTNYGGIIFHSDIKPALRTHLNQLRFEIVNECTIKLGEAEINVSDLIDHEYREYGKIFKGTVEEIKKQVTKYLIGENLRPRPGSRFWLGDNFVISNLDDTITDVKVRLIDNEMRKIEEALK